jgi:hypothetical protein
VVTLASLGTVVCVAALADVVRDVWSRSGAIPAWLVAASIAACAFVMTPSVRWLRVVRLFAGILLTICGTLLTLTLGYALEHPDARDPMLGGSMLATLVAFLATLGADLHLQHREQQEAREQQALADARHRELLDRLEVASPRPSGRRVTWAAAAALLAAGWAAGRRRR